MTVRTNSTDVIAVMTPGKDYDSTDLPSLTKFILTASVIVDRVVTCAAAKGITLSASEQELIEMWLSAHFYCMSDQPYSSKSTGGQSASFQGQTGMYLEGTKYGQNAAMVDYSGCLVNISKKQKARTVWLGKTESEQLSWDERN